jgi:hypothetical protein
MCDWQPQAVVGVLVPKQELQPLQLDTSIFGFNLKEPHGKPNWPNIKLSQTMLSQ